MGAFLLCGITDDETQVTEIQVAETNEGPTPTRIELLAIAIYNRDVDKVSQAFKDLEEIDGINAIEAMNAIRAMNADPIADKIDCILEAIYQDKSEEALQLLGDIEDKDINFINSRSIATLLGGAVLWNRKDVAQVLIERGADLNMKCFSPDAGYFALLDRYHKNCTPLGIAFIDGNKEMVEFLIKHGADVNTSIHRSTLLQRTVSQYFFLRREDKNCLWLDACGDVRNREPHTGMVRLDRSYLQLDGVDYDEIDDDCTRLPPPDQNYFLLNNAGLKFLNTRCGKKILKEVQFLIENGANVNARDKRGETVLHHLAGSFSHGGPFDFELLDFLFDAGADPRIANNKGKLPLEKFKLPDYVVERFPERKGNYDELMDMFQQRTDELNAQEFLFVESSKESTN
jgi:ankyrin repeat protein